MNKTAPSRNKSTRAHDLLQSLSLFVVHSLVQITQNTTHTKRKSSNFHRIQAGVENVSQQLPHSGVRGQCCRIQHLCSLVWRQRYHFRLTETGNGAYESDITYTNPGCAGSPSWLTLDPADDVFYCLDEGNQTPNGSVTAFKTSPDGELTVLSDHETITGQVSSVLYGEESSRAIALAHYGGHAVSTFSVAASNSFVPLQNITIALEKRGPNPDRQSAAFEHQMILDPTGQNILGPDLGADLVRVLSIDPSTNLLSEQAAPQMPAGSGPRHAVFWSSNGDVTKGYRKNSTLFLYVVTELTNTIHGFQVAYPAAGGMDFIPVSSINTFGGANVPQGAAAAEVSVSVRIFGLAPNPSFSIHVLTNLVA